MQTMAAARLGDSLHCFILSAGIWADYAGKLLFPPRLGWMEIGFKRDCTRFGKFLNIINVFIAGGAVESKIDECARLYRFSSLQENVSGMHRRYRDRHFTSSCYASCCGCLGPGPEVLSFHPAWIAHMAMAVNNARKYM